MLVANSANISYVQAKECITLSRGKELKELLQNSHVLLVLGDDEEDDAYLQLCNRLETTPEARAKDFDIAFVKDSNLKRLVMKSAKPPAPGLIEKIKQRFTETKELPTSYPEYILYKQQATDAGIRYVTEDNATNKIVDADAISDFVSSQLKRKKIGNFVYSLGTYDLVASQIMASAGPIQKVWAHVVARFMQILFLQHPLVTKESQFELDLVQEYIKIGIKVVEKGTDYPAEQVKRLQSMLDNDSGSIGELQKETLSQRIYTLQKFSEPISVDPHDLEVFIMKMALNFFTLFLMIVMVPFVLMSRVEEDDDEEEETDARDEEEDDDDKDDDDDKPISTMLSKQEKRALAIQRAKESMVDDKKKVSQVKQRKQASTTASTGIFDMAEADFNKMTVLELKEMLRDLGLKVSGKKSDLIDRLVQGRD